jgi:hypothetical protein
MKKSYEIPAHLILWILFATMVVVNGSLYLEGKPDAPFASHFSYVIFLDILLGAIMFYTTFFILPWAERKASNSFITGLFLAILLIIFAVPAFRIGILQVLSSIVPHLSLIMFAILFRKLFNSK